MVTNGAYLSPRNDGRRLAAPLHAAGVPCRRPDVPRGADVVDVYLDVQPATLLLVPVNAGTRVARVYSCVNAAPLTPSIRVSGAN